MAVTINGGTGIASVDGSAGSPGSRGTDANSGIFYAADAIKFATGGTERMSITNSGFTGITQGITYADLYRLTTDFDGNQDPAITSNWERADSSDSGYIGGVAAPSSGVFSFPVTGIWRVEFNAYFASLNHENAWPSYGIKATVDNSNYTDVSNTSDTIYDGSDSWNYGTASMHGILDVDNVSNVKVKFYAINDGGSSSIRTRGNSGYNLTYVTFIRLGDT